MQRYVQAYAQLAVRESVNKSAASAASPGYVKFQAVIKSAASAASPRGGRASGRLDHGRIEHADCSRPFAMLVSLREVPSSSIKMTSLQRILSKIQTLTKVTSPKIAKPIAFQCFFGVSQPREPSQRILQALTPNFPSKIGDLVAYVSSYCTFHRF